MMCPHIRRDGGMQTSGAADIVLESWHALASACHLLIQSHHLTDLSIAKEPDSADEACEVPGELAAKGIVTIIHLGERAVASFTSPLRRPRS